MSGATSEDPLQSSGTPATSQLTNGPTTLTCPRCRKVVTTTVAYHSGKAAKIACWVLFCLGCWPCYFIPFYSKRFLDSEHACPACGVKIGTHPRWQ
jgi:DNA-directed RNA polymerase subunit RPC12/RpoP